VEALSGATRIASRVLAALEEERLDALPAPVYVRGFIRAACAQLGLAPEEALERYEALEAARRVPGGGGERVPVPVASLLVRVVDESGARRGGRRGRQRRVGLAAGLVTAVLAAAATGAYRLAPGDRPAPAGGAAADAGGGAAARGGPGAPAPDGPPAEGGPGPRPDPPPGAAPGPAPDPRPVAAAAPGTRIVVVRADEAVWVRVEPAEGRASEELLPAGAVREWRSAGRLTVTLGNAGGVRVEVDGRALGPLGERGRVVRHVIEPAGTP
jgi:cytoskeleton protein RodZ